MMGVHARANGTFRVNLKHSKMLGSRQVTRTVPSMEDGTLWERRMRVMLDKGILPPELEENILQDVKTLGEVIDEYLLAANIAYTDQSNLSANRDEIGSDKLTDFNYDWCENWVDRLKHEKALESSTIKHRVGAMKRCIDWGLRKNYPHLTVNHLSLLPRSYSKLNESDMRRRIAAGQNLQGEGERDRRLEGNEELIIRQVLSEQPYGKHDKAVAITRLPALLFLFDLALESAMRLREMYTLHLDQMDVARETIFLDKTKNGSKRQVPMTSVSKARWLEYKAWIESGGIPGIMFNEGRVFPFWNGKTGKKQLVAATTSVSKKFTKVFEYAGIEDMHFHDMRHEATSRLFERTNLRDVEIMSITGHTGIKMLKRYANLRASNLVGRLW